MNDPKIPAGHQRLMPYYLVSDAEAFITFLKKSLGAKDREMHRGDDGRVMHAELTIGDSVLMLGQATDQWAARPTSAYLYVSDTDATHRAALKNGCTEIYDPRDEAYGVRSSGLTDTWGNTWWLAQANEAADKIIAAGRSFGAHPASRQRRASRRRTVVRVPATGAPQRIIP